jgi:hypothetical protein
VTAAYKPTSQTDRSVTISWVSRDLYNYDPDGLGLGFIRYDIKSNVPGTQSHHFHGEKSEWTRAFRKKVQDALVDVYGGDFDVDGNRTETRPIEQVRAEQHRRLARDLDLTDQEFADILAMPHVL